MANVKGSNSTNKMTVKPTGNPVTYSVRTDVNNNKIVTNASKETNTFAIKDNMSEYYARLSESFACGNGIINGVDYSSKYYASLSKEHAETAEEQKNAAIEAMDSFDSDVQAAKADIEQTRLNSIDSVNVLYDSILEGVESVRTNAIESLDQETENNKQEINALADVIKDNADSIINRVGLNMFDTVVKDHVLTYEESKGLALQGTWVYKTAIAGERYGYPDFYIKVVQEYNEATATETVNGVTVKVHSNGHKFYNIADKTGIDEFFNTMGSAWFYGIDTENECIFLPRNNYFDQATGDVSEVGLSVEAGLPNITGSLRMVNDYNWDNTGIHNVITGAFKAGTVTVGANISQNTTPSGDGIFPVSFNASLSNATYGKSNTVQPNAVKKLLYICVGNQVQDNSWVDVVTQVKNGAKDIEDKRVQALANIATDRANAIADIEQDRKQALKDLTNKENAGLSALANASNALRETQITNCIKEISQRIKYTLEDGTLTIKASSVVIVPYGVEDLTAQYPKGTTFINDNFKVYDTQFAGGKFFVWAEVQSDIASYQTSSDTNANKRPALIDLSRNLISTLMNTTSSDATFEGTGNNNNYRTDLNIIENTLSGDHKSYVMSFPFMTVVSDTTFITKSVDCVFNGFGYIGSTIWVDKGVKGLIPNGRNEDGTLNNIEVTTTKLATYSRALNGEIPLWLDANGNLALSSGVTYNEELNHVCTKTNINEIHLFCQVGVTNLTSGVVNSFNAKYPFRAVEYNDLQSLLPTGAIISSASSTSPSGFLLANGSAISRTTYAKLFNAIGTTYGEGDGSTTFNLPNYSNYNFVTSATVSVKGNGKALGLKWDTDTYALATSSSGDIGKLLGVNAGARGKNAGASISRETSPRNFYAVGVSPTASASGLTGSVTTAKTNWYIKY